jgi:hypothetical protein
VSEEREKRGPNEADADREKIADVEAHKLQDRMGEAERMGEPEEKRETDDAEVEGHILGAKHSSGKVQN